MMKQQLVLPVQQDAVIVMMILFVISAHQDTIWIVLHVNNALIIVQVALMGNHVIHVKLDMNWIVIKKDALKSLQALPMEQNVCRLLTA